MTTADETEPCPDCNGARVIGQALCQGCHGEGRVPRAAAPAEKPASLSSLFVVWTKNADPTGTPRLCVTLHSRESAEDWCVMGADRYSIAEYVPRAAAPSHPPETGVPMIEQLVFHRRAKPEETVTLCGLPCADAIVTEPANCSTCLAWAARAAEHPPELVERLSAARIEKLRRQARNYDMGEPSDRFPVRLTDLFPLLAAAERESALSAIPPAATPAWHDNPYPSEGWWLRKRDHVREWFKRFDLAESKPGDRWFGPIQIPEDK